MNNFINKIICVMKTEKNNINQKNIITEKTVKPN